MSRSDRAADDGRAALYGPPGEADDGRAAVALAQLSPGASGRVVRIRRDLTGRAERLAALGVTIGATVRLLQTFPGIVFECDQTELAVERTVAGAIFVHVEKKEAL